MKRDLAALTENSHDVVVIGGGIYGLFIAWDAALRGLSVALLEKSDFGGETSSNSLRVIHGGLRYLQHGDVVRMRRSIRERNIMMRIAPQHVHPLPFLLPTYGHGLRGKEALWLALKTHDVVGLDRNRGGDPQKNLPASRTMSRRECLDAFPGVDSDGLTGGVVYYDSQTHDSERLVLSIAHSAVELGAHLANYVEVTGLLQDGPRVIGVTAQDHATGDGIEVRGDVVVNATGPWADVVWRRLTGQQPSKSMGWSKAFNVLVDRQYVPEYAVGVYGRRTFSDLDAVVNKGSRMFFITPWRGLSLIGTAHIPFEGDPNAFEVSDEELGAFVEEINEAYPAGIGPGDIRRVYGGLLPADGQSGGEVQLTKVYRLRDHGPTDGLEGIVSVFGVKFTEARHVAEKAVDLVARKLRKPVRGCATSVTPVHGGQFGPLDPFLSREISRSPKGLHPESITSLVYRYGSAYLDVLRYMDDDTAVDEPLRVLKAEVAHGVRQEMGLTLADVAHRRASVGLTHGLGDDGLLQCSRFMADEMGWSLARAQRELDAATGGSTKTVSAA